MTCAQCITFPNFVSAGDIVCYNQVSLQDDVAYYSFPFKFELFYKNESLDEEERGKILPFKHPPTAQSLRGLRASQGFIRIGPLCQYACERPLKLGFHS